MQSAVYICVWYMCVCACSTIIWHHISSCVTPQSVLVDKFSRFLAQRAEEFIILRRKAVPGYDLSLLITNIHTESLIKEKLIDFVIHFMKEVDSEISKMKVRCSVVCV
jgi:hypothetical protein